MNTKVAAKIDDITEDVEILGKIWAEGNDPKLFDIIARKLQARERLYQFLEN